MADRSPSNTTAHHETNVVETIQSLIVAFVLAMTFRGFVTEGFVIPTGSMAPTLLGQHTLVHSQMNGWEYQIGLDQTEARLVDIDKVPDPMMGPRFPGSGFPGWVRPVGMGDRILVLKTLYPFFEPRRFDVVVFKNPTAPVGDMSNYIKRLIGLPNEQVWLSDVDFFAKAAGDNTFRIQRKPMHVQRAVWQPVYYSDFAPASVDRAREMRYEGAPWTGDPTLWEFDRHGGREYRCISAAPSLLTWDSARRSINDWNAYNALEYPRRAIRFVPVSDVRVAAHVAATEAGLVTALGLEARSHIFDFAIECRGDQSKVRLSMRPLFEPTSASNVVSKEFEVDLPAKEFNVEFWHVDQAMRLLINGEEVASLEYDWNALQRLQFATGDFLNEDIDSLLSSSLTQPQIRWRFEGSPVTLSNMRVDRDLHYRHERLPGTPHVQHRTGHAFGTHPEDNPGNLGPDQFMMCGDNSQLSHDSRMWGDPHPLVVEQIGDDSPFVVNRKLLIGKAWVVYFPAPFPLTRSGYNVVPDFGRLRFIR